MIYGLETATLTKRAFGHLQERDSGFTGQKMLNMELEKKKTTNEICGSSKGGNAESWFDRV